MLASMTGSGLTPLISRGSQFVREYGWSKSTGMKASLSLDVANSETAFFRKLVSLLLDFPCWDLILDDPSMGEMAWAWFPNTSTTLTDLKSGTASELFLGALQRSGKLFIVSAFHSTYPAGPRRAASFGRGRFSQIRAIVCVVSRQPTR